MNGDQRICASCVFFEGGTVAGTCHRYPPTTTDYYFPRVRFDSWCGEFKPGSR